MVAKDPIKIGVIGPILTSSGSSTHTKNIVNGLAEIPEWEIVLITYMEPNAVFSKVKAPAIITNNDPEQKKERTLRIPNKEKESKEILELPVRTYVFEDVVMPSNISHFYIFISNVIKHEKIRVLHPQTKPFVLFSSAMASALVWKNKIKPPIIVTTWHSNFGWIKDAKYHLALSLKGSPYADGFIPVSQNVKNDIIKYLNPSREKILDIIPPGGINLEKIQKPRKPLLEKLIQQFSLSQQYIVFLGRMLYNKGVDVLLEAYKKVIETGINVDLVIIGTGPFKEQFISLGKELNLKIMDRETGKTYNENGFGKVIFTGFITDEEVYALLQGGTVFCLPSRWESFSISTLEAMAAGLPVVCTNVGGIPFWVGDSAILVPPDSPEKTSEALIELLENKNKREEYKIKSLEKAKQYHWKELAKKTSKQIQKVLSFGIDTEKKEWGHIIEGKEGILFDEKEGKIIIKNKEILENKELGLPKEMLITPEALFFPSETIENGTYYVLIIF